MGDNLTLLDSSLKPLEDIKKEVQDSSPEQYRSDLIKKTEAERAEQQENFNTALENLNNCETVNPTIRTIKTYAVEISKTPDICLIDFTAAIEKMTLYAQGQSTITGNEINDLATEYYTLLMLYEMDRISETIYKIFRGEKDKDIKSKLGHILFAQIDKMSKTSHPIRHNVVEEIRGTEKYIQEIFQNKELFLSKWLDQHIYGDSLPIEIKEDITKLFEEIKKNHIQLATQSILNKETQFDYSTFGLIDKAPVGLKEKLLQIVINYELGKKLKQLQKVNKTIESFQPIRSGSSLPADLPPDYDQEELNLERKQEDLDLPPSSYEAPLVSQNTTLNHESPIPTLDFKHSSNEKEIENTINFIESNLDNFYTYVLIAIGNEKDEDEEKVNLKPLLELLRKNNDLRTKYIKAVYEIKKDKSSTDSLSSLLKEKPDLLSAILAIKDQQEVNDNKASPNQIEPIHSRHEEPTKEERKAKFKKIQFLNKQSQLVRWRKTYFTKQCEKIWEV